MTDPNRGEAFDLRRIFRVHRLFSAAAFALRPGALLLATFLVLVVTLGGRAWDGLRGPVIDSPGLLQPPISEPARRTVQGRLFSLMAEFVPRDQRPADLDVNAIDPRWLRAAIDRARRSLDPANDSLQIERMGRAIMEIESLTPKGAWEATSSTMALLLDRMMEGVVKLAPGVVVESLGALVIDLPVSLWKRDRGFVIIFGAFAFIVLVIGGGALSRMAAVAIAQRPALPPADAVAFALSRWPSFAFSALLPPLFVGGLFLVGGVMGLVMKVPLLNIIGGALYGVALFFGFLAALAGILWVLALPLAAPAGACDGADSIEANQRAWAYLLRRPLLALGYFVAGVVAWGLGIFVVELFAVATINLTAASGTWLSNAQSLSGAGGAKIFGPMEAPPPVLTGTARVAAALVDFWQQVVRVLVSGAALGLFWSISTAAYLCLRNACDEQPFDDLWDPEEPGGVRIETG